MRKITFDLETKNFFQDVGSNDPTDLDISVVCMHDSTTDEYTSFVEKDFNKLWPVIEQADMLITWNGDHFDIPILNKYYPGDLSKIKSLDLMKEVQKTYEDSKSRQVLLLYNAKIAEIELLRLQGKISSENF